MKPTFEEKSYENYFNGELGNLAEMYFPIGQVQEGFLGFDSTALVRNEFFWPFFHHFPYRIPRGIPLRDIAREMEYSLEDILSHIPQMTVNVLFQYKRSNWMKRRSGGEWHLWNSPYYRYDIYQDQQELLDNIDNQLGDQVLTLYAAPCFHSVGELVEHFSNKTIISNSNFRQASELSGHHRNTFTKSGSYSIACSEPEQLENFNLIELLQAYSAQSNKDINNRNFIINFRKQLIETIGQNEKLTTLLKQLNEQYNKFEEFELLYTHMVLHNVKMLTGLQWLVKTMPNNR